MQSSVYDMTEAANQKFIGIVSGGTRIAHAVAPGKHLFMVIAENADFMDAAAKYSIRSERFTGWLRDTYWVENGATAQQWYESSKESIGRKRIAYKRKWNARTAEDKAELFLHARDGV